MAEVNQASACSRLGCRAISVSTSAGATRPAAASLINVFSAFRKRAPAAYSSRIGVFRIDSSLKPGMWISNGCWSSPVAVTLQLKQQFQKTPPKSHHRKRELTLPLSCRQVVDKPRIRLVLVQPHDDPLSTQLAQDLLPDDRRDRTGQAGHDGSRPGWRAECAASCVRRGDGWAASTAANS